ncbi:FG-GAP-like repeat-containing protein [Catellatospora sichuanensis]|uniref:FG-GAP-like repeat-containing protein n=1 Tax=Catellatospora sichuanensis TaxID=1969805 RepID=UPI001FEAB7F2|nr:FG-GAP-like repeat-containing protein [Catellatospora sichuanensis]
MAHGAATALVMSLAVVGGSAPAVADPIVAPSLVDDGVYPYPGAAEILAAQNVMLISGDGHIVLADCATPPQGDIGLLKVYTTDEAIGADGIGRVCFKVTASSGLLNLQVPGVYEIRGDGQRTGTGHEVTAELVSAEGEEITVDVDPDGSTQVGLGADPDASPTMLLQLRVGTGPAPVTGGQAAVGKLSARDRMCTVTLVAPRWVLGAASCFADDPNHPQLVEGPPAGANHVVFPGHASTAVDWLSPSPGRDVVLARLAAPVPDVTPVALAAAAAPTGVDVPAVGFGRTPSDLTADQQQTAQITFTATSAGTLVAGTGPLVCSGMAGAPVLADGKLAAVLSRAGQAGCPGAAGTDSTVTAARTDDLATWFNAITTTTAAHTWTMADMPVGATPGSSVATVADSVFSGVALPMTATAGATWNTGGTYSPAVELDGVSGSLATGGPAVATNGDFNVGVWVKLDALGGVVLSQDGTNTAAFKLWTDPSDRSWRFAMSRTDAVSPVWDTAVAAPETAQLGAWTHISVHFQQPSSAQLRINGGCAASINHATTWGGTGGFRVGAVKTGAAAFGSHLDGQVANVQTWNSANMPADPAVQCNPLDWNRTPATWNSNIDFDGDAKADYLTVADNGAVAAWLNRGGDGRGGWSVFGQVAGGFGVPGSSVRFADFDGDAKADYLAVADNGAVTVWLNKGGDGRGGWSGLGLVAGGFGVPGSSVRFADFDGDRKADYLTVADNGAVTAWLNKGGDGRGGWENLGQVAGGVGVPGSRIRFADFDGDRKADYLPVADNGAVNVWLNKGGDGRGGWSNLGQVATGVGVPGSSIRFADFDGDRKADYLPVADNGAVIVWLNRGGDGRGGWSGLGQVATGVGVPRSRVWV